MKKFLALAVLAGIVLVSCNKNQPDSGKVPVTSVSLDKTSLTLQPAKTDTLTAIVSPSGATDKTVSWNSDAPLVATVDGNGVVTGVAWGTATVTVKTSDGGYTATCEVSVGPAVKTLDVTEITKDVSAKFNALLDTTAIPASTVEYGFYWGKSATALTTKVESGNISDNRYSSVVNITESGEFFCQAYAILDSSHEYRGEVVSFVMPKYPVPEAVDLGLSVKWASFDLGAKQSNKPGLYFAWGDVEGQEYNGTGFYEEFVAPEVELDDKGNLKPKYDAARKLLGGGWRMPTADEVRELLDTANCTCTWVSDYDWKGVRIMSKKPGHTENGIFIFASGYGYGKRMFAYKIYGYLWTSTRCSDRAYGLGFSEYGPECSSENRDCGFCIRPVCE